jgi:hypothetical protein
MPLNGGLSTRKPSEPIAMLRTLGAPIVAAQRLANALAPMIEYGSVPDDEGEYGQWLEIIPTDSEFQATLDVLDRALNQPASQKQARVIAGVLIDGYGRSANEASEIRVAAIAVAVADDTFLRDYDEKPTPISAETMALANLRLFRESKFPPAPAEYFVACLATRSRIEGVYCQLVQGQGWASDMRQNLEWRLTPQPEVKAGADNYIAF